MSGESIKKDGGPTRDGQAVVAAPSTSPGASSRYALWAGRVIGALVVGFLAFDGITKAMKLKPVVETTTRLGYPEGFVFGIGVTLLNCTVVCIIPRTAFLGAILLSGYFGGAVATQVRVEDPWFVFPTFVGVLVLVGLFMRDDRLRALASK